MSGGSVCRTCLVPAPNDEMHNIFGAERLDKVLKISSGLQVEPNDGLPSHICKNCERLANEASKFRHLCAISNAKLRGCLKDGDSAPLLPLRPIWQPYDCTLCFNAYSSTKELIDHVLSQHMSQIKSETGPNCLQCKMYFANEFELKKHQICHADARSGLASCPLCQQKFKRQKLLSKHIETHADNSPHKCIDCKCYFATGWYLKKHKKIHKKRHELDIDSSPTDGLSDDFFEYSDVQVKLEPDTFSTDSDIKHEQGFSENYDNLLNLDNHIYFNNCQLKSENAEEMSLTDSQSKSDNFTKKSKISKRKKKVKLLKTTTDKDNKLSDDKKPDNLSNDEGFYTKPKNKECSFLCSICGKGYFKQIALKKHIEGHKIAEIEDYSCKICGKVVHHSNHLKMHMRTHKDQNGEPIVHEDYNQKKKVILCSMCGKSCSSSSNLAVHMRRHLGVMTCICKICGKGYPRTTDLTLHMRKHTGERPFSCKQCDKSFARSDKLAIHMRIHTGEKPYKCTICGRRFAQANDLAAHKRRNNCSVNGSNQDGKGSVDGSVALSLDTKTEKILDGKMKKINGNPKPCPNDLAGGNSVDNEQLFIAHNKALELAAAVTNNFLMMSGNNANNRMLELLNSDSLTTRNLIKQNIIPDFAATQRVLELANGNVLSAHQRSEFTDYATATLLQNLSNAQSAQFDMR